MSEDRIARIGDIPAYYKKAYLQLREAVDAYLRKHDMVAWIREIEIGDYSDEDALEVFFQSKDEKVISPITVHFAGPAATGQNKASWSRAGLDCRSFSHEPIGDNDWVLAVDNGDSEEIDFADFYEGRSDSEIIDDIVSRMNTLGILVIDGARHGYVTERFAEIFEGLQDSVWDIEDASGVIKVSRNSRGTEAYSFEDAQERRIMLALPKGADEWSCYVNERLVGRGGWDDLFGDHVRMETKETIRENQMEY